MADIAALSGIKASTAERIFQDVGGEGVAVLCKATGLKRPYLRELWKALRRSLTTMLTSTRVSEVYETIAVAKAQTVLRYWNWSLVSAFSPKRWKVTTTRCGLRRVTCCTIDAAAALTAYGR